MIKNVPASQLSALISFFFFLFLKCHVYLLCSLKLWVKIIRLKVTDCDPQKEAVCTAVCVLQLLCQMVGCRWLCAQTRLQVRAHGQYIGAY